MNFSFGSRRDVQPRRASAIEGSQSPGQTALHPSAAPFMPSRASAETAEEARSRRFGTDASQPDPAGSQASELSTSPSQSAKMESSKQGKREKQGKQGKVGSCELMCPESERQRRESENELSWLERRSDNSRYTSADLCVKMHVRSQLEEIPESTLRTEPALEQTRQHLWSLLAQNNHRLHAVYAFFWDRLRAMRTDISVQNLRGDTSVRLLEEYVRFHLVSQYELCFSGNRPSESGFDTRLNLDQVKDTLNSLAEFYDDLRTNGVFYSTEAEFRAYQLLFFMADHTEFKSGPLLRSMIFYSLTTDVRKSRIVRIALRALSAHQSGNYERFLVLMENAPYVLACVMALHLPKVRRSYLWQMQKVRRKDQAPLLLSKLTHRLRLKDDDHTRRLLVHYGQSVKHVDESDVDSSELGWAHSDRIVPEIGFSFEYSDHSMPSIDARRPLRWVDAVQKPVRVQDLPDGIETEKRHPLVTGDQHSLPLSPTWSAFSGQTAASTVPSPPHSHLEQQDECEGLEKQLQHAADENQQQRELKQWWSLPQQHSLTRGSNAFSGATSTFHTSTGNIGFGKLPSEQQMQEQWRNVEQSQQSQDALHMHSERAFDKEEHQQQGSLLPDESRSTTPTTSTRNSSITDAHRLEIISSGVHRREAVQANDTSSALGVNEQESSLSGASKRKRPSVAKTSVPHEEVKRDEATNMTDQTGDDVNEQRIKQRRRDSGISTHTAPSRLAESARKRGRREKQEREQRDKRTEQLRQAFHRFAQRRKQRKTRELGRRWHEHARAAAAQRNYEAQQLEWLSWMDGAPSARTGKVYGTTLTRITMRLDAHLQEEDQLAPPVDILSAGVDILAQKSVKMWKCVMSSGLSGCAQPTQRGTKRAAWARAIFGGDAYNASSDSQVALFTALLRLSGRREKVHVSVKDVHTNRTSEEYSGADALVFVRGDVQESAASEEERMCALMAQAPAGAQLPLLVIDARDTTQADDSEAFDREALQHTACGDAIRRTAVVHASPEDGCRAAQPLTHALRWLAEQAKQSPQLEKFSVLQLAFENMDNMLHLLRKDIKHEMSPYECAEAFNFCLQLVKECVQSAARSHGSFGWPAAEFEHLRDESCIKFPEHGWSIERVQYVCETLEVMMLRRDFEVGDEPDKESMNLEHVLGGRQCAVWEVSKHSSWLELHRHAMYINIASAYSRLQEESMHAWVEAGATKAMKERIIQKAKELSCTCRQRLEKQRQQLGRESKRTGPQNADYIKLHQSDCAEQAHSEKEASWHESTEDAQKVGLQQHVEKLLQRGFKRFNDELQEERKEEEKLKERLKRYGLLRYGADRPQGGTAAPNSAEGLSSFSAKEMHRDSSSDEHVQEQRCVTRLNHLIAREEQEHMQLKDKIWHDLTTVSPRIKWYVENAEQPEQQSALMERKRQVKRGKWR